MTKPLGMIPRTGCSALALCATLSATPALAQDTSAQLEEIVVTATRRLSTVLDVPYNISAVEGSTIDKARIQDTAELMRGMPGITMVDRGYRNGSVVNGVRIRGMNVDSASLGDYAVSAVSTVSTYVNDTPLLANFLLRDIKRVEFLRGPQGTLYGSGSLAGTIRYIMQEPNTDFSEGRAAIGVSHADGSGSIGWTADAMLNKPLSDKLALRLNAAHIDQPGTVDYVNLYKLNAKGVPDAPNGILNPAATYVTDKDADDVDIWFARAELLAELSETFKLKASFAHQSDDVGGRRAETRGVDGYGHAYGHDQNGAVMAEPSSRDVDLAALEATADFGFATLTSSTSWYDHEGDSISDNSGFYAKAGFLSFYYNYPRPADVAVRSYGDRSIVEELRLVSNEPVWIFDYVVGLYYQDQDLKSDQQNVLLGFKSWYDAKYPKSAASVAGDVDFDYHRRESFTDKAVFGELTGHLTDSFQITGGLRAFKNKARNHTTMDLPLYTAYANPTSVDFPQDDSKVLFKGNASWKPDEDTLVYATISEGYRRGGSNAVPTRGNFAEDVRWQTYNADTAVNYEMGVKGRIGSQRYGLTGFYVDWSHIQLNTATPVWGFYVVQNGGSARSKGAELELSGPLAPGLSYTLGYTYVDAQLTDNVVAPYNPTLVVAAKGTTLPSAPRHAATVSLQHEQTVANDLRLTTRLSGYYQSASRNAVVRSATYNVGIAPFQIWNLSAGLARDGWDATLFVKNVFNADGVTGIFTERYAGTAPGQGFYGNTNRYLLSQPRTIGLSVSYSF